MVLATAATVTATVGITKTILEVKNQEKEKERSEHPIAKRKRFKTRKAAKEAAERENKTKDPIVAHPAGGKNKQPHYHPNKNSHDHFYFPKRFWIVNMFVKYKKYKDDDKNDE